MRIRTRPATTLPCGTPSVPPRRPSFIAVPCESSADRRSRDCFFSKRWLGPARRESGMTRDPGQDGARVGDDRPVRQLERRQLRVSGRLAQLFARALAEERDRMTVGGDHLLVLDVRGTECLLYPATRMPPRAPVIAVAHIQRRRFDHHRSYSGSFSPLMGTETALSNRLPATAPEP